MEYNSKKYYLDNLVEIYNSNFEEKIDKNKIKNNFENKKCIFREYDSNIQYKLPCGCDLCHHFIEFFKSFSFNCHFICKCSEQYNRPLMLDLGTLFFSKSDINPNQIISKKIIINYFNYRLSKNCCLKNEDLKEDDKQYLKNLIIKDNDRNSNQNQNNFLSHLNHKICQKCKSITLPNEFYCRICGISHTFKKE